MENSNNYGEIITFLLATKALQEKDVIYADRVKQKLTDSKSLLNVLKDLKFITDETIRTTIQGSQLTLRIGDLLVELGYLHPEDLHAAFTIQKETEKSLKLGEILIKYNFIDENLFYHILSMQLGFPFVNPDISTVDRKMTAKVPLKILTAQTFIPLKTDEGGCLVAFQDPLDQTAVQIARRFFGAEFKPAIASKKSLADVLRLLSHEASGKTVDVDSSTIIGLVSTRSSSLRSRKTSAISISSPMPIACRSVFARMAFLATTKIFPVISPRP